MAWTWDEMIDEFRALGGTADNVTVGTGALGRGMFAIDPDKPATLAVPENLLFPVDDLEFRDGRLCVKAESTMGAKEKDFFDRYQEAFSWGAGGRAECEAILARVAAAPDDLRQALNAEVNLDLVWNGDPDPVVRAQKRFLGTRMITRKGAFVIMPVLELVNHDPQGGMVDMKGGISLSGLFPQEMRFRYVVNDPLAYFVCWGFGSPESVAFSLPLTMKLGDGRTLVVRRQLNEATKGARLTPPKPTGEGDKVILPFALLGAEGYPRLAKTYFYAAMREIDARNPEAIFDNVAHFNRMRFIKLLEILDDRPGELAAGLRRMARFQLAAMSRHLGAREAAAASPEAARATADA